MLLLVLKLQERAILNTSKQRATHFYDFGIIWSFKMPNQTKTHKDCWKTVCFLCLKKSTRTFSPSMVQEISSLFEQKVNFENERMPIRICEGCRSTLCRKLDRKEVVMPRLYDLETINLRRPASGLICDCIICQVGHLKLNESHPLEKVRKMTTWEEKAVNKNLTSDHRCSKCLTVLLKGISLVCTEAKFRENMRLLTSNDSTVAQQIAASAIAGTNASPQGTILLAQAKVDNLYLSPQVKMTLL